MGQHYSSVIEDGYTPHRFVKGIPGLFRDFRGRMRPMLHEQRYIVSGRVGDPSRSSGQASRTIVEAVCRHFIEWDIKTEDGETLKIDYEHVCKVQSDLLERLYRIVTGVDPGDNDPENPWSSDVADNEYEAMVTGQAPEDVAVKNS